MSTILEKYDRAFVFSGIVMNLMLAIQHFLLWVNPSINDLNKIKSLSTLILFEFFMVHSGVVMASMPKKISLFIFFPLYGLFFLGINSSINNNTILITYCMVVFNRMRFAFSDPSEEMKEIAEGKSAFAAVIYFMLFLIIFLLPIPEFGLTEEFLTTSGYYENLNTGRSLDTPQHAICMGFVYYILLALVEYMYINDPIN